MATTVAYDELTETRIHREVKGGSRWEDVPETWSCPDCSATKADFERVEV